MGRLHTDFSSNFLTSNFLDSNKGLSPEDSFKAAAEKARNEARQELDQVAQEALAILKAHYKTPETLAAFITEQGTPVVVLPGNVLGRLGVLLLGFEFGFVAPPKNAAHAKNSLIKKLYAFRYSLLGRLCGLNAHSAKSGLFVLIPPLFTAGFMAHQLHHWLAFKAGLPGYHPTEQQLYKRFWNTQKGVLAVSEVNRMTAEEIKGLRNAIQRDLEALCFIRQVVAQVFVPAQQAKHLANGSLSV